MIKVLLAEDQALVREGLRLLLELQGDLAVTAVADGAEAVERARHEAFDVALLDVRMPRVDGVTCLRRLRALQPDLPVLMLTTFDDDRLVQECLAAGATAYLLKDMAAEDLANAVRLVVLGGQLIPGDLARRLVARADAGAGTGPGRPAEEGRCQGPGPREGGRPLEAAPAGGETVPADRCRGRGVAPSPAAPGDGSAAAATGGSSRGGTPPAAGAQAPWGAGAPASGILGRLTARQREILALLAQGLTNREIAARLHLSEGTVKNVVSEIYARLEVRDRVEAVLRARGWLGGPPGAGGG